MTTSISFPYTIDNTGKVTSVTSTGKLYVDRVLTLLSTNVGQRPMLPQYGVDWSTAIFENDGDSTGAITQAITLAVSKWIPEVSISSIEIGNASPDGIKDVTIGLILPDNSLYTLAVNTALFNYDGTITRL